MIEKLDYISALGVDIVWICPIYKSPQVDMGYDVADYRAIDPRYGTMQDVEALIDGLHRRGLKLLMDLVVNHTSDQHAWFQESRSAKDNPYRDWYIWRDPRYDSHGCRQPPNNWSAYFGGSAWTFDETTQQYYLHLFSPQQPDLNWECNEMRNEVYSVIRFWLDKGVDGFRLDVINLISKDPALPDANVTDASKRYHHGCEHYANGPRLHEYLRIIGGILKEYDAFSVGEMPWIHDPDEILRCVGSDRGELNMIFNFEVVEGIDHGSGGKFCPKEWQMSELKSIVKQWQTFMQENKGWNALFLENHDQARTVSRWASDSPEHRQNAAKMFATFLGLLCGTLFIYQGQELGMTNIPREWPMSDYHDLETLNHWKELCESTTEDDEARAIAREQYHLKSRDNARTPMQWSREPNAGFSSAAPWFRVNSTYRECNAESQVGVPGSPFEHWALILRLRKAMPGIFVYGKFQTVDEGEDDVFAYTRASRGELALVVCNFRERHVRWKVPPRVLDLKTSHLVAGTHSEPVHEDGVVHLRPFEAFVLVQMGAFSRL